MSINSAMKVGQLAALFPLSTRVFARHHIDYCCGGGRPLAEVCAKHGLDAGMIIKEIEREVETPRASTISWNTAPINDLVDHILAVYHRPLDEELPRLAAMANKVLTVHGEKDPARLTAIHATFTEIKAELEPHMAKEEQILFPMIRAGQGAMAGGPIEVMEADHEVVGAALKRMRHLTGDYVVPAAACNTWRALWHGLAALETSLLEHIHLENNILFPRVLAGQPVGVAGK